MRRAGLLALMISLSLLAGCASGTDWEEKFSERRAQLAAAEELSFTAKLSADLGETVFDCALRCRRTAEETEVRVLEPELAEGVTVRFANDGTHIGYGGTQLYLGQTDADIPTPAQAAPMIFRALTEGHAVRVWTEESEGEELLCAQVYAGEDSSVLLWLDADALEPEYAQIVCAGRAVISCELSDFSCGADEGLETGDDAVLNTR